MLFSVIGAALISAAVCVLLQKTNPEFSMMTSILTGALIFVVVIVNFTPVLDQIEQWANEFGLNYEAISIVVKALGVCYLTQLAADSCKDAGYSSIAGKVELGGKIAVIVLALPLFSGLLDMVKQLTSMGGGF